MVLNPATGALDSGGRFVNSGWELTLANIYSIRRGHVEDPTGTISGDTSGWSVGLHFKDALGFSYDHAEVPQSIYLDRITRKALNLYFDPLKAWAVLHPRTRV